MSNAKQTLAMNATQELYRFENAMIDLPDDNYTLEVKEGDVWVFLDNQDKILHTGESLSLKRETHAKIRKLYSNAHVSYKLNK